MSGQKWTQAQAVELCRKVETIAPKYGCHVALTGGTLYHFGERKDVDILFYRIRQADGIDVDGLMEALRDLGITPGQDFGWCHKATYEGRAIDFFFPERDGGTPPEYDGEPVHWESQKDRIAGLERNLAAAEKWASDYERQHGQFKSDPPMPGFMISF